jgi:2-keto-4-pentenoate hydratase
MHTNNSVILYWLLVSLLLFGSSQANHYRNAASIFTKSRITSAPLDTNPFGTFEAKEADGYLVQKEYLKGTRFGRLIGWKIGATNSAAQAAMKFGPFYGPLFSSFKTSESSTVSLSALGSSFRAAEAEIAFCMKKGLPKRTDGSEYTDEEVWDAIESTFGAIEIASTRYTQTLSPAIVLADFALNGCFVLGTPLSLSGMKFSDFADVSASLETDGKHLAKEFGSNVLGNPVSALRWLANQMNKDGLALKAGDIVITGAICASKEVTLPGLLTAKFDGGAFSSNPVEVRLNLSR